jgi:hypothetical protein
VLLYVARLFFGEGGFIRRPLSHLKLPRTIAMRAGSASSTTLPI